MARQMQRPERSQEGSARKSHRMQEAAAKKGDFRELRHRKVCHTAILYAVGAWLLMQLADVVFPGWDLPDAAINILFVERIDDTGDFAAKLHKAHAIRRASIG